MSALDLLFEDAEDLVLGALLAPQWGVYLNGSPVIQPATVSTMLDGVSGDVAAALAAVATIGGLLGAVIGPGGLVPAVASTIRFEFGQDWDLPTYPQEQGAFQAYNKVTLPYDVKIRLACNGGGPGERQAFIQNCLAIGNSTALFDIVTPEITFTSVNCSHMSILPRDAQRGVSLIQIDLYFKQIPVVSSTTFQNTQQPGNAGTVAAGNPQAQTPNQYVSNNFATGNWTLN